MENSYRNIDKDNITSKLLQEYLTFKEENEDCIILMQVGSFYEAYFEDATSLSKVAGITLTNKTIKEVGTFHQAGVPIGNITLYIKKLLNNDYKVCLCPQFEDEKHQFYRKISRKYTKGTIIENELLDNNDNNYLLAIKKDNSSYHLAYCDVSTGEFYKTIDNKKNIIDEVEKINPVELLVLENDKKCFEELVSKYNTTILNSKYSTKNIEEIIKLYCHTTQKEFRTKLNKIVQYNINNYMFLDELTRRNLELTRIRKTLKKKGSLFSLFNNTRTPMGSRLLKQYIDKPLLDVEEIKKRQQAIEEINEEKLCEYQDILKNFCDLSRICSKISNSTIGAKELLSMADNSSPLEKLNELSLHTSSTLLKLEQNKLNKTLELAYEIKKAIQKENQNEKGIIKEGYDTNLDYLKNKLYIVKKEIKSYEERERKNTDIDSLKIEYSKTIGYFIEVQSNYAHKLNNDYFKKQSLAKTTRYTTERLKELEEETYKLNYQIKEYEQELFEKIKQYASKFIDIIRELSNQIAQIDVLTSLSETAIKYHFIKPNFINGDISIQNGYHPTLLLNDCKICTNDTELKNNEVMILTGTNMSGKSTYLKQNAIICLLAQIGSFVPCDDCELCILNKIILRQGSIDDISDNKSSFMVEMEDLKYILDNSDSQTLVLLDEPAKSTSSKEGGMIARAFLEYLIENYQTKTIVATHNLEITKLEKTYPRQATNYVIGKSNSQDNQFIDRKITKGIMKTSLAVKTAKLANLPEEIISKIKKYSIW